MLETYSFSDEYLEYENYMNMEQIIEERMKDRLFFVLKTIVKYFIIRNNYIKKLKNSK